MCCRDWPRSARSWFCSTTFSGPSRPRCSCSVTWAVLWSMCRCCWSVSARDTDERRSSELRAVLADLECRPGRRICLGGFDDDELADLTASLLAVNAAAVTSAVSARLRDQTAGNPLYATQLVRHWAESGYLALAATEVEFADGATGDEVPANLRNLLWSRVSSLGDEVVEVLSAAAVLGTQFAVGAVIDMAGISDSDAMDALDVAEAAGLLAEVAARAPTLRFVHVLVARAVYGGLPRGRRRRLHAQAAEVLAKRAGAPTIHLAAQIARQYNLGGMLAEARRWAITAGDYAAGQLSPAEAARWYRTALDHGATLDVPDQRARWSPRPARPRSAAGRRSRRPRDLDRSGGAGPWLWCDRDRGAGRPGHRPRVPAARPRRPRAGGARRVRPRSGRRRSGHARPAPRPAGRGSRLRRGRDPAHRAGPGGHRAGRCQPRSGASGPDLLVGAVRPVGPRPRGDAAAGGRGQQVDRGRGGRR